MSQVDQVYASPRYGFGSPELVGVVTVICVVAFCVLKSCGSARSRAREQACASNVTQIVRAMTIYSSDHGGRYPPESANTITAICPYTKNLQIFRCPTDAEPLEVEYEGAADYYSEASSALTLELSYFLVGGLSDDERPSEVLIGDNVARHQGRANVACIDGRLRSVSPEELSAYAGGGSDRQ